MGSIIRYNPTEEIMNFDVEMMDAAVEEDRGQFQQPDIPEATEADTTDSRPKLESQIQTRTQTIVPTKLHIRGLDILSTSDIRAYITDHCVAPARIEWIDDSSANLVFGSETSARDALLSLSAVSVSDLSQLPALEHLLAKPLDNRPEVNLQIRFAVVSDRKEAGAAERSRYYLLHPDKDPTERRRRERDRARYRDRDDGDDGGSRASHHDRVTAMDRDRDIEVFNDSFYDDTPSNSRRRSPAGDRSRHRLLFDDARSDGGEDSRLYNDHDNTSKELFPAIRLSETKELFPAFRLNETKELFPSNRLDRRNRSASPRGRLYADTSPSDTDGSRARNKTSSRAIKHKLSHDRRFRNDELSKYKDRVGDKDNLAKELFPTKPTSSLRRGHMDRLEAAIESTRLQTVDTTAEELSRELGPNGLKIRGQAGHPTTVPYGASGLSIKEAAKATVNELFPSNLNTNQGKELFLDQFNDKTGRRKRAEDHFY